MTASTEIAAEAGTKPAAKILPREYLAFRLGNEEYGIDILTVQEIRGYEISTQVANAPQFMKGFLNWRDIIVPILDLRIKFNLGEPTYDTLTVVIILEIDERFVGIVVDSVSDVMSLSPDQIRPAPPMGTVLNTDNLIGLGALEDRMLILMDIKKLMESPEMGLADLPGM
ncbi:MAG: chemotaxis protein CheW [Burkholderiaceae bacterium]|jgi:purine-binding chemotaxis protein CheW|nr:chemotaxis protein CheW [Burkholderiaceae bacterium]